MWMMQGVVQPHVLTRSTANEHVIFTSAAINEGCSHLLRVIERRESRNEVPDFAHASQLWKCMCTLFFLPRLSDTIVLPLLTLCYVEQ